MTTIHGRKIQGDSNRSNTIMTSAKSLLRKERNLAAAIRGEVPIALVGMTGFEPATSWSQTRRSSQAELHPERGDSLEGIDQSVNEDRFTWNNSCDRIYAALCSFPTILSKSSFEAKSMMIFPLSLALPDSLISTLVPSQSRS